MQELAVLLTGCRQLSIIPYNPRDYCKSSENFVALDSHKSACVFLTPLNNLLQKDPHEIYILVCFPTKMVIAQRLYAIVTWRPVTKFSFLSPHQNHILAPPSRNRQN